MQMCAINLTTRIRSCSVVGLTLALARFAGFNTEKGYGFIALDGEDKDVFVHQSDIYAPGFRSLAEGEALEFRLTTDERTGKVKAVDVTGPDGAYVQGAPRRDEGDDYY